MYRDNITLNDTLNDSITLTPDALWFPNGKPKTNRTLSDPFTESSFGVLREGGLVEPVTCFKDRRSFPGVKNVIYNNPATIVFWTDGTKTVVKCMEGCEYDEYTGFMAAVCKKAFGSSSAVRKIVHQFMSKAVDNEDAKHE